MKNRLMPNTKLGKWSRGLLIGFLILLVLGTVIASIQRPTADQTFFSNPLFSILMISPVVAAIFSFLTGIVAVFKKKERSILVLLSTAIGLLILVILLGEFLFPH
ncbi:hypothetical protein [Tepidibacillus marianensis]|uniref:hypothetical protein n=1 Tax=Tepidibacillus marianensis TaxID=3131995 RepID=UPI0030D4E828